MTGALLATIAWARAQYPLLEAREVIGLAMHWAADLLPVGAGIGLAIALGVRAAGVRSRATPLAAGIAVLAVAGVVALRGGAPVAVRATVAPAPLVASAPAVPAPNLVLITIDTLRADHLDAYGYARATAPSLTAFAADGVLFENAIAAAPATQLAVASLMTGLWPTSHADPSRRRPQGAPYLRSGFTTLAERFAAAGYGTAGFVANLAVRASEGYAQGFVTWDETAARHGTAERVLEPALAWLATARAPYFLWVHFMDPHHPYDAAALAPWEDPADLHAAALRLEWRSMTTDAQTKRMLAVRGERDLDAATRAVLIDRYDAEIRHADAALGELLAALARSGVTRANTWIAVAADHGEEFLDHGRLTHGHSLFDELLHVPLVVRGPSTPAGLRVAEQVSMVDLAATLLDAAGQTGADVDGRSLAPFWQKPGREPARDAIASREGKYVAWRTAEHKLVVAQAPAPAERAPVRGFAALGWMARVAFDSEHRPKVGYWPVADEPRESSFAPGSYDAARRAHAELVATAALRPPRDVAEDAPMVQDAATIEQLRALGYAQ